MRLDFSQIAATKSWVYMLPITLLLAVAKPVMAHENLNCVLRDITEEEEISLLKEAENFGSKKDSEKSSGFSKILNAKAEKCASSQGWKDEQQSMAFIYGLFALKERAERNRYPTSANFLQRFSRQLSAKEQKDVRKAAVTVVAGITEDVGAERRPSAIPALAMLYLSGIMEKKLPDISQQERDQALNLFLYKTTKEVAIEIFDAAAVGGVSESADEQNPASSTVPPTEVSQRREQIPTYPPAVTEPNPN